MSEDALLVESRDQVDWVTMNRPAASNALDQSLIEALLGYFEGLRDNHAVRIVVLRANGRHFCAGADLASGAFDDDSRTPHNIWRAQRQISDIYRALRRCPQPIIALVQGAACGGGFSLALASDIRIAADSAKMNAAFIKIGLTGADMGSSYFLPRLVGTSVASELLLTGRFIHAERALAVNLVSEVVPESELEAAGQRYIADMLRTSPMGLRLTKEAVNMSVDAGSLDAALAMEDRHQALLMMTDDSVEAVMSFLEKREPDFKDS
mgnify:FL=1